jgi:hypothetical protein
MFSLNTARRAQRARDALRDQLEIARAELRTLLDTVRAAQRDRRRLRAAGLALERIASEKLHRLLGHPTFAALLAAELGMSRVTAHKWRAIARALDAATIAELGVEAAYARVRRAVAKKRARDPEDELRALLSRLRRKGVVGAKAELVTRRGKRFVRVLIPASSCRSLA